MALSNWDTLAVDETGAPTGGVVRSLLGVEVAIYKNWLYVRDEAAWQDGGAFVRPTVMEIQEGRMRYKDVDIVARRGPQEGVYCVITAPKGEEYRGAVMVGCGVYGYDDREWVGVKSESVAFLRAWLDEYTTDDVMVWQGEAGAEAEAALVRVAEGLDAGDAVRLDGGEVVLTTMSHVFDERVRAIDLKGAIRFNQGDAYFADRLGFSVPATPPGEAAAVLFCTSSS